MDNHMYDFKNQFTLEKRKEQSRKLLANHYDRIPVIIQKVSGSSNVADIEKKRYLVPYDTNIASFMMLIRKQVLLNQNNAFYMFCGDKNIIVSGSNTFQHLYLNYKDEDGFLYLQYAGENVFGC